MWQKLHASTVHVVHGNDMVPRLPSCPTWMQGHIPNWLREKLPSTTLKMLNLIGLHRYAGLAGTTDRLLSNLTKHMTLLGRYNPVGTTVFVTKQRKTGEAVACQAGARDLLGLPPSGPQLDDSLLRDHQFSGYFESGLLRELFNGPAMASSSPWHTVYDDGSEDAEGDQPVA